MTLLWSPESIHDLIALRAHIAEHDPAAAKLSALIAAVVVPGFLYSQVHGTKVTLVPTGLEMIQRDHAVSAPAQMLSDRLTETAEDKVAYR
jgi:hypothetical protein